MWQSTIPDEHENLRQGDLLVDVPMPTLSGKQEIENGRISLRATPRPCLVLSQCCTIENRKSVHIARIVKTQSLAPEMPIYRALTSEWPVKPGDVLYEGMALDAVPGALDPLPEGRFWMVDFRIGLTLVDDIAWMQEHRRARMTSIARRNLRLRLVGFYSRPTKEDRAELDAVGEWSGLDDAPPWTSAAG